MEHFHNTAPSSATDLNLYGGLNPAFLSAPTKRHSSELNHLNHTSVDLFPANAGLYIPPEETQPQEPVDELSGWTFSDDEQMDTDDEDMDGNEFDTDFAELELPPPHADTFSVDFVDHTGHIPFEGVSPYEPDHYTQPNASFSDHAYPSNAYNPSAFPSSAFNSSAFPPSAYNSSAYNSSAYAAPDYSVDPACLTYPKIFTENSNPNAVALPPAEVPAEIPAYNPAPEHAADSQMMMDMNDFDLEMAMDDFYAPITSHNLENAVDLAELDKVDMFPAEIGNETQNETHHAPHHAPHHENHHENHNFGYESDLKNPPNRRSSTDLDANESTLVEPELLPPTDLHIPSPPDSPPLKPRRKSPPRRRAPRATASATHSGPYVCNLTYHDGGECNRSFTRPYDLVRHQETLHAAVRKTFTCEVCGSHSKKFSRMDALSRHMRLKHSA